MKNIRSFIPVRSNTFIAVCLLSVVLLASACKKSNENIPPTPVAALMAFNLAPDVPSLGIALSGNNLTNTPLSFTNYTGTYLNIYPGSRSIESYNAGSNATLASNTYNFEEGKFYTLFVAGANNVYKNIVTSDNYDSLSATSGKAYIRYINAIPDSSKPAVTITAGGSNIVNEQAAFTGVSDFTEVNPGEVTVAINNQGNIQANRTINLEQRKAYTVLLVGIPGETDTDKRVQIRYIENGSLTDDTGTGGQ